MHSQLAASEATAASLKAELLKAEAQAREAGSLQQAVEQAEQGRRALAQDWQKEQALLEKQLQAAGRNRDQLAEQVLSSAVIMSVFWYRPACQAMKHRVICVRSLAI